MSILILICIALPVFCNTVLFKMVDKYRSMNNGIEVNISERREANLYRVIILIVIAISIFCSDYWWAPIIGYILGSMGGNMVSNEDTVAYINFFGKILKPITLISAIICTFV